MVHHVPYMDEQSLKNKTVSGFSEILSYILLIDSVVMFECGNLCFKETLDSSNNGSLSLSTSHEKTLDAKMFITICRHY